MSGIIGSNNGNGSFKFKIPRNLMKSAFNANRWMGNRQRFRGQYKVAYMIHFAKSSLRFMSFFKILCHIERRLMFKVQMVTSTKGAWKQTASRLNFPVC